MVNELKQFAWINYLRITHPSCTIRAASISRNVTLENNVTLEYGSHIQASFIGKYTYINKYCLIDKGTASIGRFCSVAYATKTGLGSHPVNWVSTHAMAYEKKYGFTPENIDSGSDNGKMTVIGNDVWIGASAIVLKGVQIGDGAIIGAGALVNHDVEPYSIVLGSPARHYRYRFSQEIREGLLKLRWWDWEDEKIRKNISLFSDPEKLLMIS